MYVTQKGVLENFNTENDGIFEITYRENKEGKSCFLSCSDVISESNDYGVFCGIFVDSILLTKIKEVGTLLVNVTINFMFFNCEKLEDIDVNLFSKKTCIGC